MGKNRGDKLPINNIVAALLLTPLEMRVAQLQRMGIGRNGISSALELSVNTVKTITSRINGKLGVNWMHNCLIVWPTHSDKNNDGNNCREYVQEKLQEWPNPLDKKIHEKINKNRAFTNLMLVCQSKYGCYLLKVSGSQRFWLKPVLTNLVEWRYIKLIEVDWFDVFKPPWLPLVNRGRKVSRSAIYSIVKYHRVMIVLENYFKYELENYIGEVCDQIDRVWHLNMKNVSLTRERFLVSISEELGI
ncbi:MAG: helix-turn-helix domain-containing protein [Bacillota bacterium]